MSNDVSEATEAAVKEILEATNHYVAISASRDATTVEIRRCYLKKSVLVHPDKTKHPDATKAFQRVAAAWAVLGDDTKRRRYDQQLACGRPGDDLPSDDEDEINMTPEEAFVAFAFAAAASAAGGGGGMPDMAETLFWAQQLQQGGASNSMPGFFPGGWGSPASAQQQYPWASSSPFSFTPAAVQERQEMANTANGLAMSAGLWAAGALAGAAGLPRIGGAACRFAMVQGVSQLVMASQIPTVRGHLESGASAATAKATVLAETLGSAGSVVGERVRDSTANLRGSLVGDAAFEGFGSCLPTLKTDRAEVGETGGTEGSEGGVSSFGGVSAALRETLSVQGERLRVSASSLGVALSQNGVSASLSSCLPKPKERKTREEDTRSSRGGRESGSRNTNRRQPLRAGTWVRLFGLKQAVELENRMGEVVGYDRERERYQVRLFPKQLGMCTGAPCPSVDAAKLIKRENIEIAAQRSSSPPREASKFV